MDHRKTHDVAIAMPIGYWDFVTESLKDKINYISNLKRGDIDDDSYADFKNDQQVYGSILLDIEEAVAAKLEQTARELKDRPTAERRPL